MKKLEHLLVPVDLSENAAALVTQAIDLVRESGATMHLLHVVDRPPTMTPAYVGPLSSYGALYADQMERGSEQLSSLARLAEEAGIRYERTLALGNPCEEILRRAGEVEADMIVMATHGRHGLARLFLGSTTEAVVRGATCPVLTMRPTVMAAQEVTPLVL